MLCTFPGYKSQKKRCRLTIDVHCLKFVLCLHVLAEHCVKFVLSLHVLAVHCVTFVLCLHVLAVHRGSYMSAHVLLNLLNKLGKRDKMRGLPSI